MSELYYELGGPQLVGHAMGAPAARASETRRDQVGDVDVFVRPPVFSGFLCRGWNLEAPNPADPPFLSFAVPGAPTIHAFDKWTPRDAWLDVGRCFDLSELVRGYRCVPLAEILRHKREAWAGAGRNPDAPQAKHQRDIEILEEHLAA